jgi:hypothetical protein
MSDFLSKLKGIFVVQTTADGKTVESAPKPATTTTNVVPLAPASVSGKVSDKFYDILFGAMEANNQEGFDYLEYKKSLQTLSKMPMDEQTRYASAFAAAQAMGITASKLNESAQFYLNILKSEEIVVPLEETNQ